MGVPEANSFCRVKDGALVGCGLWRDGSEGKIPCGDLDGNASLNVSRRAPLAVVLLALLSFFAA